MPSIAVLKHLDPGLLSDPNVLAPLGAAQVAQVLGCVARAQSSGGGAKVWERYLMDAVKEKVPAAARPALWRLLEGVLVPAGPRHFQSDKKYLTPTEVAKELGVTPPTVRAWIASGALRAERTGQLGKRIYYKIRREDLDLFLRSGGMRGSGTPADPAVEASRLLGKINGWTKGRK
jgi:excisionase family DNA binding protein